MCALLSSPLLSSPPSSKRGLNFFSFVGDGLRRGDWPISRIINMRVLRVRERGAGSKDHLEEKKSAKNKEIIFFWGVMGICAKMLVSSTPRSSLPTRGGQFACIPKNSSTRVGLQTISGHTVRWFFFPPKCTQQMTHSKLKWLYLDSKASKNNRLWGWGHHNNKSFLF